MDEEVKEQILLYKIPLIFGIIGIIILIFSFIFSTSLRFGAMGDLGENAIEIIDKEQNQATVAGKFSKNTIFVDIEGAVEKPGVYELLDKSRVADLIEKAGGLTKQADLDYMAKNINRAQELVDGVKIYIPDKSAVSNSQPITLNSKININTASASDLETLSGVGPKTAEKIINNRPYSKIGELLDKKIVGNSVFEKIKTKISVF